MADNTCSSLSLLYIEIYHISALTSALADMCSLQMMWFFWLLQGRAKMFHLNHSRVCFLWNGRNWMWGQYLNVNTVSSCDCVHFTAQIEHLANSPPLSHLVPIENSLVVQSRCSASQILWVSCLDFLKTPQHFDFHLAGSHSVEWFFTAGNKSCLGAGRADCHCELMSCKAATLEKSRTSSCTFGHKPWSSRRVTGLYWKRSFRHFLFLLS